MLHVHSEVSLSVSLCHSTITGTGEQETPALPGSLWRVNQSGLECRVAGLVPV